MKRSQFYSQIFIYALALILTSFILIYGYNAITNIQNKAKQVSCIKLQNDMKNSIDAIIGDFGSVKRKDFELCGSFTQICFVESFDKPSLQADTDPIIKDSVLSNSGKNVFLVDNVAKDSFYIGKISVEPDVLCIKAASSKISLRLESRGNFVELSE